MKNVLYSCFFIFLFWYDGLILMKWMYVFVGFCWEMKLYRNLMSWFWLMLTVAKLVRGKWLKNSRGSMVVIGCLFYYLLTRFMMYG